MILRRPWKRPSIEYAPAPIMESETDNATMVVLIAGSTREKKNDTTSRNATIAELRDVNKPSAMRIANTMEANERMPIGPPVS